MIYHAVHENAVKVPFHVHGKKLLNINLFGIDETLLNGVLLPTLFLAVNIVNQSMENKQKGHSSRNL